MQMTLNLLSLVPSFNCYMDIDIKSRQEFKRSGFFLKEIMIIAQPTESLRLIMATMEHLN